MRSRRLGQSGLVVSEICLGTMTFGSMADERTSHAILDRAFDAGIDSARSILGVGKRHVPRIAALDVDMPHAAHIDAVESREVTCIVRNRAVGARGTVLLR